QPFSAATPLANTVLFAGVGRFSNGSGDGGLLTGLLRTIDGGDHWTQLGQKDLSGLSVASVVPTSVLDPTTGRQAILVAAMRGDRTGGGVYRSNDGGTTFQLTLARGDASDLVADPSDSRRFYAAVPGQGVFRGIFNSANGSLIWTPVNTDLSGI